MDGNTYNQEIILTYSNEPPNGWIAVELNGRDGWQLFPITGSPQSIILENLSANGEEVDVFVKFTDDNQCTFSSDDLFVAPANCVDAPSSEVSFTLIDAEHDVPINEYDPIPAGATIDLSSLPTDQLNIRANTGTLNTMGFQFTLTGQDNWSNYENIQPYALFGDTQDDYYPWINSGPQIGNYSLTGIPKLAGWVDGETVTLNFSFIESSARLYRHALSIKVYPNPFQYELNIEAPNLMTEKVRVSLLNMIGQEVYSQDLIIENINHILPRYLPEGVYTLRIEGEDILYTKRIIKH